MANSKKNYSFSITLIVLAILIIVVYYALFGFNFLHRKSPNHDTESIIYWSKDRPLKISDYIPTIKKEHNAKFTGLTYGRNAWNFYVSNDTLYYYVKAYFVKDSSYWAFTDTSRFSPPARLRQRIYDLEVLKHEQTHFDIFEVYARKGRQFCSLLTNVSDTAYIDNEMKKLWGELLARHVAYDSETNHSLIENEQMKWDLKIEQLLDALKDYENPEGIIKLKK